VPICTIIGSVLGDLVLNIMWLSKPHNIKEVQLWILLQIE
jgi:hypothetical protein